MKKCFTEEMKAAILSVRQSGMRMKDICEKYDVTSQSIRRWMKGQDGVIGSTLLRKTTTVSHYLYRRSGKFSEDCRKEIVARY